MFMLRLLALLLLIFIAVPQISFAQNDVIESEPLEPPGSSVPAETTSDENPATSEEPPPAGEEEDVTLTELPDMTSMEDMKYVSLRTIDKLSARTHTFDIPVEKAVKFGKSLFIKARACRSASPLSQPENAAFLQIWERKPEEDKPKWVFSGWMFSSNPSLSAMDHAVYDVWVIACKNSLTSKTSAAAVKKEEPAKQEAADTPVEETSAPVAESSATKPEGAEDIPEAAEAEEVKASTPPKLEDVPSSFEESE